jgi:hypothetical protein
VSYTNMHACIIEAEVILSAIDGCKLCVDQACGNQNQISIILMISELAILAVATVCNVTRLQFYAQLQTGLGKLADIFLTSRLYSLSLFPSFLYLFFLSSPSLSRPRSSNSFLLREAALLDFFKWRGISCEVQHAMNTCKRPVS